MYERNLTLAIPDNFDLFSRLDYIFVGRESELKRFRIHIREWLNGLDGEQQKHSANNNLILPYTQSYKELDDERNKAESIPPNRKNRLPGPVIYLYGRGGFGKSTLLGQYYSIAQEHHEHIKLIDEVIDWEDLTASERSIVTAISSRSHTSAATISSANSTSPDELEAQPFYDLLCHYLAHAFNRFPKDFKYYQDAVKVVREAHDAAETALKGITASNENKYKWLGKLESKTIGVLLRMSHTLDDTQIEKIEKGLEKGINVSAETLAHVRQVLIKRLGNKWEVYLNPAIRLGQALGHDLAHFARHQPLLLFFDTYEVIHDGDELIRTVMMAAGKRVGWVIAGRDNLWGGPTQQARSLYTAELSYKDIVNTNLGLAINFESEDVGRFGLAELEEYFEKLAASLPIPDPFAISTTTIVPVASENESPVSVPRLRFTPEELKAILAVTDGVPLAIRLAVALYLETNQIEYLTTFPEESGELGMIDLLVRRYLLHTRTLPQDRDYLYGLALLRSGPYKHREEELCAALGLDKDRKSNYGEELTRLHRRYSFVFTPKDRYATLHEEVRRAIRVNLLLNQAEAGKATEIARRLKDVYLNRLTELEVQREYTSLKQRFGDGDWVKTYLDISEQTYWIDPSLGLYYLMPLMTLVAIYAREINKEAIEIGQFFSNTLQAPYRNWWQALYNGLSPAHNFFPIIYISKDEIASLRLLENVMKEGRYPSFPSGLKLPQSFNEAKAALWWRLGEAYQGSDDIQALKYYEQALVVSPVLEEKALKDAAARAAFDIAITFNDQKKYDESLSMLDRAIELVPGFSTAYNNRGILYLKQKKYDHALSDYTKAINYGNMPVHVAYSNRSTIYYKLRKYEQAFNDCAKAIELAPYDTPPYTNAGLVQLMYKKPEEAVRYFQAGFDINPHDINTGWMIQWTKLKPEQPTDEEAQQLIVALKNLANRNPGLYVAYVCRGIDTALQGDVDKALEWMEQSSELEDADFDHYFWLGLLYAYKGKIETARQAIEKALALDMPPILLTPLYWLQSYSPDMFEQVARPFLDKYHI